MTEQEFSDTIDKLEKKHSSYLKLAFLAAILELRNEIDDEAINSAIANNSVNDVYREINPDQFDNLLHGIGMDKKNLIFSDESISLFHIAAAIAFAELLPSIQRKWNYNPLNERAVSTLLQNNALIASELTESLKSSVSMLLNPTVAYASDLTARMRDIKQTLGLTTPQAQAVLNFRNQLQTQKLLGFTAPQNRLMPETDRLLLRDHMKNGTLTQSGIDKMVNRYYESLLNQRASEIATATAMNAINSGMNEMWNQGLNQGIFDSRDRKFWMTQLDNKVRATHRAIPTMNPQGVAINSMFVTPHGLVPYPMWGMGGFVHCRCYVVLGRI